MRLISTFTDPNEMVNAYGDRVGRLTNVEGILSISRRGLSYPQFRITRWSGWESDGPDPWRERDKLPLLSGGVLAELIYSGEARIINNFVPDPADPAYPYIKTFRAINAVPHFDGGQALNMVVAYFENDAGRFNPDAFPEMVWMSNLFGRGVNNMVLGRQLREAYNEIDRELKVVGDIQQSLLPREMPTLRTADLAAYYQTSRRAGGDYFDFFQLPSDKLGILLADVSGHGTPAAVLMAVLHALAHQFPGEPASPSRVLAYINQQLATRYTDGGMFVTAFYGVYDDATRTLEFASAGHNPPLLVRTGSGERVDRLMGTGLPLGITTDADYGDSRVTLGKGDLLCLYTDGITETRAVSGPAMFGEDLLAAAMRRGSGTPAEIIGQVLDEVSTYSGGAAAADDRTMILLRAK